MRISFIFLFGVCLLATLCDVSAQQQGFSRISNATANSGEASFRSAAINSAGTIGYFGANTNPGYAIKFNLATMTRSAASAQNSGEIACNGIVLDEANNFLYCATETVLPASQSQLPSRTKSTLQFHQA